MPEIIEAVRLPGLRLDSLGNYLAALGLMKSCTVRWPGLRGLWHGEEFVVGAAGLGKEDLAGYLRDAWRPSKYERWWMGSKEIAKLRAWEPSLARVKILDAHIVAKGDSRVFNDVLGTGGNVGKRDFSKVAEDCCELTRSPSAGDWLEYTLFGSPLAAGMRLPDLPSTGTWFASANKAFNSGYKSAREGQLSPWSFLLALEGAILLRGGTGRKLSARASKYATFPFISDAAAPETEGQAKKERSEFWAPVWKTPATLNEILGLLRRSQARVGRRAARAPFDFAVAALTTQSQAGLDRFVRFCLRETTSANTYEAISAGTVSVASSGTLSKELVQLADWADFLPTDKKVFSGLRAPFERALIRIAQNPVPENWRELLVTVARTQRRVDQNKNWRKARVVSKLAERFFDRSWPEAIPPEVDIARAISSLETSGYGLRHNIFGITTVRTLQRESFADPRPASVVWHDGDPVRVLADVLERRLIDAQDDKATPPLHAMRYCSPEALDHFVSGRLEAAEVVRWVPSLALLKWRRPTVGDTAHGLPPLSPEFLLQGYFRPLITPVPLALRKGIEAIHPDALRARALIKMIRGEMWEQAFAVGERAYRSLGVEVMGPPKALSANGDRIAASLLVPIETKVIRQAFKRWTVRNLKGKQ